MSEGEKTLIKGALCEPDEACLEIVFLKQKPTTN
jgi:hypothetical protein